MCRRFEEWSSEIQKYCEENDTYGLFIKLYDWRKERRRTSR